MSLPAAGVSAAASSQRRRSIAYREGVAAAANASRMCGMILSVGDFIDHALGSFGLAGLQVAVYEEIHRVRFEE